MATGRPTKYRPEYAEQAKKLCEIMGATDKELADYFGVSIPTIFKWSADYPDFLDAKKTAKLSANERVKNRLYDRAMGMKVMDTDIRVVDGRLVHTPIERELPPDTTAMIFWLKNREPDQWRDKQELEVDLKVSLGEQVAAARQRAAQAGTDEQG